MDLKSIIMLACMLEFLSFFLVHSMFSLCIVIEICHELWSCQFWNNSIGNCCMGGGFANVMHEAFQVVDMERELKFSLTIVVRNITQPRPLMILYFICNMFEELDYGFGQLWANLDNCAPWPRLIGMGNFFIALQGSFYFLRVIFCNHYLKL